ncbi:PilZ domain-containing protein [bacterium]|nr:MAG: PilZ domain-containing protein [bacterium]
MTGSSRIFKTEATVVRQPGKRQYRVSAERSVDMAKNMNAAQLYRESEPMGDKRNFERFSMEVPALIECLRPKRRRRLLLKTTNLSASGVYFNTPKPFPTGAHVKVEMFLHDKDLESWPVITVTGRVTRSDPKGMSLSFNEDFDITIMEASAKSTPDSLLCPLQSGESGSSI